MRTSEQQQTWSNVTHPQEARTQIARPCNQIPDDPPDALQKPNPLKAPSRLQQLLWHLLLSLSHRTPSSQNRSLGNIHRPCRNPFMQAEGQASWHHRRYASHCRPAKPTKTTLRFTLPPYDSAPDPNRDPKQSRAKRTGKAATPPGTCTAPGRLPWSGANRTKLENNLPPTLHASLVAMRPVRRT